MSTDVEAGLDGCIRHTMEWSVEGECSWISSSSPGRANISFYGLYLYHLGETRIWPYACANGDNTNDMFHRLREEFPEIKITIIWDGAPYHHAQAVKDQADTLGIHLEPLPGYSPDFMPVEHLWQWLREAVTYHTCYDTKQALIDQVAQFEKMPLRMRLLIACGDKPI